MGEQQDRLAEIHQRVNVARDLVDRPDETAAPLTVEEAILLLAEVERLRGRLSELVMSCSCEQCPGCGATRRDDVIRHGPGCWVVEATLY